MMKKGPNPKDRRLWLAVKRTASMAPLLGASQWRAENVSSSSDVRVGWIFSVITIFLLER